MPALGLQPRADATAIAAPEGCVLVADREPVDIGEVDVVVDLDDATEQRDVHSPVLAENRERDTLVAANVGKAGAAYVHVEERTAVLPVVPGGHGVRRTVTLQRGDDRRMRLGKE